MSPAATPTPRTGACMSVLRRVRTVAPAVAATLLIAACASDAPQDTLKPKGTYSQTIANLINPVFGVAGVVFVVVLGGALFIALKFRVRDDSHFDDMPAQIHGNNTLEIGWTIIPALILLGIGVFSVIAIFELNETPPQDSVKVQVVGQQWWWEYRYDLNDDGVYDEIVTANDLVIPAGEKVALEVTARDVIHSFWAPALNGKRDAVPNRRHPWNLQADEPGEYIGQCTEFCGLSHAEMRIKVIALPRDQYDDWVEGQTTTAPTYAEDDTSQEAQGYRVFTGQLCASCHLIEGVNDDNFDDDAVGEFHRDINGGPGTIVDPELQASLHAPNLTHLMSRTTFAGAKFDLRRDTEACDALGVDWADTQEGVDQCLDRGALEAWLRNPPAEKAMDAEGTPRARHAQPEPVRGTDRPAGRLPHDAQVGRRHP